MLALSALAVTIVGCAGTDAPGAPGQSPTAPPSPTSTSTSTPGPSSSTPDAPATTPTGASPADPGPTEPTGSATAAPDWLGTRVLEEGEDGRIPPQPTPPELVDRRIVTTDLLPPPADGEFAATVEPVPDDVLRRSTWSEDCPVSRDELRYVTVTFHGFDEQPHTGELLVHEAAADDLVAVFRDLYAAGFPIEEMRVVTPADLDAPPTGDGNNTTAFVCRPTRGSASWSEHAYGRAIDVNPFHNPYERDGIVLPELASAYTDRDDVRPGMILEDGPVVAAFRAAGWGWGGAWQSHTDPMHFSVSGR